MTESRRTESTIVFVLIGVLAGAGLVWSDPSGRFLVMLGSGAFLSLFFIKPEKLLIAYLVVSPVIDQFIPFFTVGRFGPHILFRGGLLVLLMLYWVISMRNPLTFKVTRPMFMLMALLTVSAIVFAGSRDSRQEFTNLAKLASWMLMMVTVADMVFRGRMKINSIYRAMTFSLLVSVISLSIFSMLGIKTHVERYRLGEFGGAFVLHNIAISLSIGIIGVMALAMAHRGNFVLLLLLGLTGLAAFGVMRTYVRTGYFGFISAILMLNLMLWRYRRYKGVKRQRVIVFAVLLVVIVVGVSYTLLHFEAVEKRFTDFTGSGRRTLWTQALQHYLDYPIFSQVFGGGYESAFRFYGRFLSTHNGYLLFLLYGGAAGLCLYFWLLVSIWMEIVPSDQSDYLPSVIAGAALGTFMIIEMINGAALYQSPTTYFAFLVGGAIGYYKMKRIQSLKNTDSYRNPLQETKSVVASRALPPSSKRV